MLQLAYKSPAQLTYIFPYFSPSESDCTYAHRLCYDTICPRHIQSDSGSIAAIDTKSKSTKAVDCVRGANWQRIRPSGVNKQEQVTPA